MKVNLIPMSGKGTRFANAGYKLPKPLIPVSGKPMIINVIERAPTADKWIFVVREEHVIEHKIDEVIKDLLPEAVIIIDKNPIGQATTCLLARDEVKPDDELFITACDSACLYNEEKYLELQTDPSVDSIVWTFTELDSMRIKPESYGWHELDEDGLTIKNVSCKAPISSDPYHDHAVVATFWFKRADTFFVASDQMISRGDKIKDEYYVDIIPNYSRKLGKRSVIFDVDLFSCWGTPAEYENYQTMENYCINNEGDLTDEQLRLLPIWRKYFKKNMKLSIVVPCYNEEKNIPLILKRFEAIRSNEAFELILVNNNSKDNSAKVLEEFKKKYEYSFLRVVDEPKPGYGHAVMAGLRTAQGDVLSWTHADLQTDPDDVLKAFERYKNGTVVKGRRLKRGGVDGIFTFFMGILASTILLKKLWDVNAQPKLFDREFFELINEPPGDFNLDLYMLYLAKKHHYKVLDVPVIFGERVHGESKSAPNLKVKFKNSWSTIKFIFKLRMIVD
jgi:polyisoprenyl-phosphate glycosyltransferase